MGRQFQIMMSRANKNRQFVLTTLLANVLVLFVAANSVPAQPLAPEQESSTAASTSGSAPAAQNATPSSPSVQSHFGPGSDASSAYAFPSHPDGPPPYKPLRYDEDYRYLADPAFRTDSWDQLKYIPLGDHEDWFMSFGGQIRPRSDNYNNSNFGTIPGGNSYLLQRYLVHGDFHFGPNVRFFGQLLSGLETGRIGGPRPDIDRDVFDGHQAFVDVVQDLDDQSALTWRVGRQEMRYGSGRLIDVREGVNNRRSFDAARLLYKSGDWSVDAFFSKPALNKTDVFDDNWNPKINFWGAYAVTPLAALPDGHADLYYLGYENQQGVFEQGSGYEMRHSIGTHLWGRPTPWDYDIEAIWQFGRFGSGNIAAWAIASTTGYNFAELPFRPRVGLVADIASGDRNPNSSNLQTFNPMFPTGAYLNLSNPIGPANFMQVHPCVDLHFGENVMFKADWAFVWRESIHDGIYGPFVGPPIRTGQLSDARYVGSSPSATVTWKATRHVTLVASYVHFFAGAFLKETPPGKDMDYATVWLDYTF
ncbi:MAG: alginate export family protein [Planctomycetota bacterium]